MKSTSVTCPECGEIGTFPSDDAKLDYWVYGDGIFRWECFECNHEWEGNFKGEKL